MKTRPTMVFAAVVLAVAMVSGCTQQPVTGQAVYSVAGGVSYTDRPDPVYTSEFFNETSHATIQKVVYKSRLAAIYGLLAIPKDGNNHPAFVLLPAQSITKEVEQMWLGNKLNEMGFATLALDQRTMGETGGYAPTMQEDFNSYINGEETAQSMMVYDALAAYDILRSLPEIDPLSIYMEGESMGGRYAIIAAAIEPNIRGLLLISTAGYGLPEGESPEATEFLRYVDPDNYIGKVRPRKTLMIHGTQDRVIPPEPAKNTFELANEPKKFIEVDERFHGYYNVLGNSTLPTILEDNVMGWLVE